MSLIERWKAWFYRPAPEPPKPVKIPQPEAVAVDKPKPHPNELRIGQTDRRVRELQAALKRAGFNPGPLDGIFGPATQAAVIAFQRSEDLPPCGIADTLTLRRLYELPALAGDDLLAVFSPELVARLFPHTPMANIRENLPRVLHALSSLDLGCRDMVLMALATIRAECEPWVPIGEGVSRYNTSPGGAPFDLYDYRSDLGNQGTPDGERYRGRGFIQLTGRWNYQHFSQRLGLGDLLVNDPEQANDPDIAADLLAVFLKSRERELRTALMDGSLKTARRLINGGSHGLARFVETYHKGANLVALYDNGDTHA